MLSDFNWCVGRPLVSTIHRCVLHAVFNVTRFLKVQKPDKKRKILNHVGRESLDNFQKKTFSSLTHTSIEEH